MFWILITGNSDLFAGESFLKATDSLSLTKAMRNAKSLETYAMDFLYPFTEQLN
jgi:hypothetical protein